MYIVGNGLPLGVIFNITVKILTMDKGNHARAHTYFNTVYDLNGAASGFPTDFIIKITIMYTSMPVNL